MATHAQGGGDRDDQEVSPVSESRVTPPPTFVLVKRFGGRIPARLVRTVVEIEYFDENGNPTGNMDRIALHEVTTKGTLEEMLQKAVPEDSAIRNVEIIKETLNRR